MARHTGRFLLFASALALALASASCSGSSSLKGGPKTGTWTLFADGHPVSVRGRPIPNGWVLSPAGTQVETLPQPSGIALSADGKGVFAVTSSQWDQEVAYVSLQQPSHILKAPAASAFRGVLDLGSGKILVSGGGKDKLYVYSFSPSGLQAPPNSTSVVPPLASPLGIPAPGYPAGMTSSSDRVYVALSLPLSQSQLASYGASGCPAVPGEPLEGASLTPASLPVPCSAVAVYDQGALASLAPGSSGPPPIAVVPTGLDAYQVAAGKDGRTLYVSDWAGLPQAGSGQPTTTGYVTVLRTDPPGPRVVAVVPVGREPMGLAVSPDGRRLAVANSMSDTVTILSLSSAGLPVEAKTVAVGAAVRGVKGSEPTDVAFSADGKYLFVALFGLNAVEVLHPDGTPIPEHLKVSSQAGQRAVDVPETLVPVGWMPVALATGRLAEGSPYLVVANFQGNGTNKGFYNPASDYVGEGATEGSLSIIRGLSPSAMARYTAQALLADNLLGLFDRAVPSSSTDPCVRDAAQEVVSALLCSKKTPGPSPYHVVVIYRENKTVDSMLGYMGSLLPGFWGSELYETYSPQATVNLGAIASSYGVDDNSWVAGDESETGHMVFTSGMTTPPNELFVHVNNDFGLRGHRAGDPLSSDPPSRLADEFLSHGLTERTYGGDLNPDSPAKANDVPPAIWGNAPSAIFSGTNTDYPDTNRAEIFTKGTTIDMGWDQYHNPTPPPDFGKLVGLCGAPSGSCDYPGAAPTDYERYSLAAWNAAYATCRKAGKSDTACQSAMPNLVIIELADDHTDVLNAGNNPYMWSPAVMVANDDYATGEIVQALSESPFWRDTLVAITEDDTQFTADHINVLRSYLVLAGGLSRLALGKAKVSHQVSSFCSLDKTIEDLFSLPPQAVCDATAAPLGTLVADAPGSPPSYHLRDTGIPHLLGDPVTPERLQVWCASDKPEGLGFAGLLHYQKEECFGSYVGALAKTLNLG
jgi:DNA-binding beta-propeller fold protein YncE